MVDLSLGLKTRPSMQPDPRHERVKAASKATCKGKTTDKGLCGRHCKAEPIASVLDRASITLYTCVPKKKAASNTPIATVVDTTTTTTCFATLTSIPTMSTLSKPGASTSNTMETASCGGTARALSACPTQCPASAIPGGLGVIYSCVDPSNTASPSLTPTTVEVSTTTLALTTASSTTSATSPASTSTSLTSNTAQITTFETSFLPTVTQNDPTSTKKTSSASTSPVLQSHNPFQETSTGAATIAVSLIAGLAIVGLAIYLWRRHKRMTQEVDTTQPERVQLRSDTGNSSSNGIPETRRNLSLREILTNTTREEYHAQHASELRQADRAAMTARYYRNKPSHTEG